MMITTPLEQGGVFLFQFISSLIIFALMLRFLMRATNVDWHNPIVSFVAKVTNPLCAPVSKFMPVKGRWDWAAIVTALIIQSLVVIIIGWMIGKNFGAVLIAISAVTEVLNQLLDMMFWLIIIQVVFSWLNQGSTPNPSAAIFDDLTRPILAPFQRLVPPIGGIDLSPIVAIVAIKLTQIVVVGSIAQVGQRMIG